MPHSYHTRLAFVMLTVLLLGLGGCGVKPGRVDPPAGKAGNAFPRVYPAGPAPVQVETPPAVPAAPPAAPVVQGTPQPATKTGASPRFRP